MSCSETFRFRQVYLKRLVETLEGLKNSSSSNDDEVTGLDDHNIKLVVDVSLALSAKQAAWSRALLHRISNDEKNRAALRKILEPNKFQEILAQRLRYQAHLVLQSKLKRPHVHEQQRKISVGIISRILSTKRLEPVTSVHSSLVNERKRKLQRLVPGGKTMDTSCLLQETAHYITSLTTQTMSCSETSRFRQVYLKRLVETLEGLKNSSSSNDDEVTGSNDHNIKLAVDVSLALSAKQAAWSRALLRRISNDEKNRAALRKILGPKKFQEILAQRLQYPAHLVLQSKLKRAHVHKQQRNISVGIISRILSTKRLEPVTSVHSSLVNERKRKLQRLVPGGKQWTLPACFKKQYITSHLSQHR